MSNSLIGNNGAPQEFLSWYETEIDEDEYEELEGEFVFETDITGFRAICPKNSQTTTVNFKYYYYAPTSEWYWDYNYSSGYTPLIPLVYSCDNDWKLTECLNQSLVETSMTNQGNGWKTLTATLKRKLRQGERIFCGIYSDRMGFAILEESDPDTTSCYQYFANERRRNYTSQIAYITSANFLSKQRNLNCDYEVCLYIEYENEIESVAYTRTVLGNVRASTGNSRKMIWKRTLQPGGNVSSYLSRKSVWIRNANSSGSVASASQRHNLLKRGNASGFSVTSENSNRIFFFRFLEGSSSLTSRASRACRMKIENSDGFSLSDSLQQLLLIIRSCFSSAESSENLRLKADYKRMSESVVDDEESIIRWGESFRSFTDEVEFEAHPFASRLFFRTVQTVMSLWDWIRGKIREANNVVTFFCPIHLEIEMECRI